MAQLIYRGVAHDGVREITLLTKRDLIYRGAGHDGLVALTARSLHEVPLCYRGARHLLSRGPEQVASPRSPAFTTTRAPEEKQLVSA